MPSKEWIRERMGRNIAAYTLGMSLKSEPRLWRKYLTDEEVLRIAAGYLNCPPEDVPKMFQRRYDGNLVGWGENESRRRPR